MDTTTSKRITIDEDRDYAPCSYLVCQVDEDGKWDTRDEDTTILVQADYNYGSLAALTGWTGDPNDLTLIDDAGAWIDAHLGEVVDDPGYFGGVA